MFARNAFDSVNADLDLVMRLDKSFGIREAVRLLSVEDGQGMTKCNCLGDCKSNRCSCKKIICFAIRDAMVVVLIAKINNFSF